MYTYNINVLECDEYDGKYYYYWCSSCSALTTGFYDTKEKAIEYAMEAVKNITK